MEILFYRARALLNFSIRIYIFLKVDGNDPKMKTGSEPLLAKSKTTKNGKAYEDSDGSAPGPVCGFVGFDPGELLIASCGINPPIAFLP